MSVPESPRSPDYDAMDWKGHDDEEPVNPNTEAASTPAPHFEAAVALERLASRDSGVADLEDDDMRKAIPRPVPRIKLQIPSINDPHRDPQSQQPSLEEFASRLKLTHKLSVFDQAAPRRYLRRMFVFDFPIMNLETFGEAANAIWRGLASAFKAYPFLSGVLKVGIRDTEWTGERHTERAAPTEMGPPLMPASAYKNLPPYGLDGTFMSLRYGDTEELRRVHKWNLKIVTHPSSVNTDYEEWADAGMPTSHLKKEDYSAAQCDGDLSSWMPVVALQASFLQDGALVSPMTYEPKDIEEIFKDNITNKRDDKTSLNDIDEWNFHENSTPFESQSNS
ncbi:mitochondrial 5-aminolevulinate synthase [Pestalotiopsis sp. IQ-011]